MAQINEKHPGALIIGFGSPTCEGRAFSEQPSLVTHLAFDGQFIFSDWLL